MNKDEKTYTLPGTRKQKFISWALVAGLFLVFFIFFRNYHQVVPWDGDDWRQIGSGTFGAESIIPVFSGLVSEAFFGEALGKIGGYIAAFVIYPITGDYIMSQMTVVAIVLALSISFSLVCVYELMKVIFEGEGKRTPLILVALFLLCGFDFFKTQAGGGAFLYWQYNLCTAYHYSVPSYLASALVVCFVKWHLTGRRFGINFRTAFVLTAIYLLMFSFLHAAILIAVVSAMILLDDLLKIKKTKLKTIVKDDAIHLYVLVLFLIKMYGEYKRVFSGYQSVLGNFWISLKASFAFFWSTFGMMERVFFWLMVISVAVSIVIYVSKFAKKKLTDGDKRWSKVIAILVASLIFAWFYSVAYAAISIAHFSVYFMPIRLDTTYFMYFLVLLIVVLCSAFVISNIRWTKLVLLIVMSIMMVNIVASTSLLAESYCGCLGTAKQRYEIMSQVVEKIQENERDGIYTTVAHIPAYGHYGGGSMTYALYVHKITSRLCSIEFVYDSPDNNVYFE